MALQYFAAARVSQNIILFLCCGANIQELDMRLLTPKLHIPPSLHPSPFCFLKQA